MPFGKDHDIGVERIGIPHGKGPGWLSPQPSPAAIVADFFAKGTTFVRRNGSRLSRYINGLIQIRRNDGRDDPDFRRRRTADINRCVRIGLVTSTIPVAVVP